MGTLGSAASCRFSWPLSSHAFCGLAFCGHIVSFTYVGFCRRFVEIGSVTHPLMEIIGVVVRKFGLAVSSMVARWRCGSMAFSLTVAL